MSSSHQVLSLYKQMLRNASHFQGYNYRSYAQRRVREEFRKNKTLAPGSAEQEKALAFGQNQAQMLFRQVTISKLYPPETKSIMESFA